MPDQDGNVLPWEREGYGFSGPLDPLHSSKLNAAAVEQWRETPPEAPNGDLGSAVVVIAREPGDITVIGLREEDPSISDDDFDTIRQQHAHLR